MIHDRHHTDIAAAIIAERRRQEKLMAEGKFAFGPESNDLTNAQKLAVVVEEVGEVARAVCESIDGSAESRANLEEELVQVAAVVVGWLEGLRENLVAASTPPPPPPPAPKKWGVFDQSGRRSLWLPGMYESVGEAWQAVTERHQGRDHGNWNIKQVSE